MAWRPAAIILTSGLGGVLIVRAARGTRTGIGAPRPTLSVSTRLWDELRTYPDQQARQTKGQELSVLIGRVAMHLHFLDGVLFEQAKARYKAFQGSSQRPLPIRLSRHKRSDLPRADFSYCLEGARLHCTAHEARFLGVCHEYALDSLLRILLSWVLLPQVGFLLHAATILRGGRAYVFMGRSGAGKSTLASLSPVGAALTDEISLLRREDGVWHAFSTPFWGEFRGGATNASAEVAGIYQVAQADRHRLHELAPSEGLRVLLPNVLFFSRNFRDTQQLLDILAQAVREVSFGRLEFQKNAGFWEVLP